MTSITYEKESNKYLTTISNVNHTSNPTMLQSVGIEYEQSYRREATTDVNTGSEIELLLSPFAIINNTSSTTNASDSTVNEVLNHPWTFYIEFSIQLLVTVLTIFGNLTIILCVSRHKNLQRPSHFFIASLATTDLFLGLTVMVPRLTDEAFGGWYFGYFMCQCYHAMDVTLCTSSILHLCCISVDRYYAIVNHPLLYYERVTKRKALVGIASSWILAGLTGFVPVFTGIYSDPSVLEQHQIEAKADTVIACDLAPNKYFSIIAGCISFWLPGSIIVFVYASVYRETRRLSKQNQARLGQLSTGRLSSTNTNTLSNTNVNITQREIEAMQLVKRHENESPIQTADLNNDQSDQTRASSKESNFTDTGDETQPLNEKKSRNSCPSDKYLEISTRKSTPDTTHERSFSLRPKWKVSTNSAAVQMELNKERESGAAKTLGIVVGVFIICWLPFFIWMPVTALFELITPGWLYDIILWTGYGNSAINPFIYGLFSAEFRTAMFKEKRRCGNFFLICYSDQDGEERSCCRKREIV